MVPVRHTPKTISDRIAKTFTLAMRWVADTFFAKRYGHRAIVLETVAAVPGMVGGMLTHLKSLRQMRPGHGPKIRTLLEEAENERMHLMTFIEIAQPSGLERMIVLLTQFVFWHTYFLIYVVSPRTAHRIVGYFEEEAVVSYTHYLEQVITTPSLNVPAPQIAIDYWNLSHDSTLADVIVAVRADEQRHSAVNHQYADQGRL